MNICRTRRGNVQPDQYTAVAPTFGGYHVPSRFALLDFVEVPAAPAFAHGTIDDVRPEELQRALQVQEGSSGKVELVTDRVYAGSQAAHITVPENGLGAITLRAAVKAETGYRALITHYNHVTGHGPGAREQTPHTRVIFEGASGKAVTPTSGYSWDGTAALQDPDTWRVTPHVFTTSPGTTHVRLTIFFARAGEYWVDEVRLEEL